MDKIFLKFILGVSLFIVSGQSFAKVKFVLEPFVGYGSASGTTKLLGDTKVSYASPLFGLSAGFRFSNSLAYYGVFDVAENTLETQTSDGTKSSMKVRNGSSSLALAWHGKRIEFRLILTAISKITLDEEAFKEDSFEGTGGGIGLGYRISKYSKILFRYKELTYNKYVDADTTNTPFTTDMKDIKISEMSVLLVIPFEFDMNL
jgi:hypothetical protein